MRGSQVIKWGADLRWRTEGRWRVSMEGVLMAALALLLCGMGRQAHALPLYARQTGQSCAACHAGGQFPELTPYGRQFKLTGYTMGQRGIPLAAMVVADMSSTRKNHDSSGVQVSNLNDKGIFDFASIFAGGKITDNIGAFVQFTYTAHDRPDALGNWIGHFGSDNTDIRFADHLVSDEADWVYGLSVNNNPGVQDVWNSMPAWGYPYAVSTAVPTAGAPVSTLLEGGLAQQVVGVGGYAMYNRSLYLEVTDYVPPNGALQVLSVGNKTGDGNHPRTIIDGWAPYVRLAYNPSWGAHNAMVGAAVFNANVHGNDPDTNLPVYGNVGTRFRDLSLDAQYQYLLDPHALTAQLRWIHERINDPNNYVLADQRDAHINTFLAKVSYTWDAWVGGSLAFYKVTGTSDSSYAGTGTQYGSDTALVVASANNSPRTQSWTPEVYWLPMPNLRLGLQYTAFSEYLGARRNYDGQARNASDNNTAFLYAWFAY